MYCHQCGKEVGNDAKYCPYCGTPLELSQPNYSTYQPIHEQGANYQNDDSPSIGFAILSFLVPLLGLVLFIVWNRDYPQKAKSCLKGLIAGVVLYFISLCCLFSAIGNAASPYDQQFYFDSVVETIPYE